MKYSLNLFAVSCLIFFSSCHTSIKKPERPKAPEKVLIFGIDAAAWKILEPLCQAGHTPTIKMLMDQGAYCDLITLHPTVSVMLWTTIATGMLPEHHGIESWLVQGSDTSGQLAITSNYRKVPALWNFLSDKYSVLFSNWWATWPAEKVHGVMISNRAHFPELKQTVYPPEMEQIVKTTRRLSDQEITREISSYNPYHVQLSLSPFLLRQLQKDRFYLDAAARVMQQKSFHVAGVFVRGIDILEHEFLNDIMPFDNAPKIPESDRGIIVSYYRYLDRQLARFLKIMGDSTTVIVVSDHGMEPVKKLPPLIEGLKLDKLLRLVYFSKSPEKPQPVQINFKDNKKYPPGSVKGIAYTGVQDVHDRAVQQQINELVEKLKQVRLDAQPLFSKITVSDKPGEICTVTLNPEKSVKSEITVNGKSYPLMSLVDFVIHPKAGQHWHAPNGIFLISGPGISSRGKVEPIHIQDIAPTITTLLRHPISRAFDGKPQTRFFSSDFNQLYPIKYVEKYAFNRQVLRAENNKDIDTTIKGELRTLGYIQ